MSSCREIPIGFKQLELPLGSLTCDFYKPHKTLLIKLCLYLLPLKTNRLFFEKYRLPLTMLE